MLSAKAPATGSADVMPAVDNRHRARRRPTTRLLHRWIGLAAGLWLAVLGATGFVLDHRDGWRWLWQETVNEAWVPERVLDKARRGATRLYQVNPAQPTERIAGGPQGLWISQNGGDHWASVYFSGATGTPQIRAVLPDATRQWDRLWLATDDGLWALDRPHKTAISVTLGGHDITALATGASPTELLGVSARSRIFRVDTRSPRPPLQVELGLPEDSQLPPDIGLSRLVHDLHFGRGLFAPPWSLLLNDAGAWCMMLLPLGGFLFWWLPRRWRQQPERPPRRARKNTMRWLYRLHGPTLGLFAVIPFVYLSLTGIVLDHGDALRPWLKQFAIAKAWQPPVYSLPAWRGEIYAVAGYPGQPRKFSLGTRLGLFTTTNDGLGWQRETHGPVAPGFVWSLRRHEDRLLLGGMGGPNLQRAGEGPWRPVPGSGHMPTDVSPDGQGGLIWLNRDGLHRGGNDVPYRETTAALPRRDGVPWFYVLDGLHSGALIHPQWKWVNDGVAIACLLLLVTGLLRWWRKRWL